MKQFTLKKYNLFIAFLLTILGFGASCTKFKISPGIEYGSPHATFKVYGKVTSENGINIPAIRVIMKPDQLYPWPDTVISDYYGNYEVRLSAHPTHQNYTLEFKDIDGAAHGSYQAKDTTVKFINPVFEGGESWYKGETSKEMNIKLKEE